MKALLLENLNHITGFVITIILTFIAVNLVRKLFDKFLLRIASQNGDITNYSFLRYIAIAIVYAIGLMLAAYNVPALRAIGTTLLAGAGVLALAISFASQQALSNVIGGLFIVIFKPFRIKDRLILKSRVLEGFVEDITLRHTVIRDYENRRIIVPNSVISQEIIVNADYGDGFIHNKIDIGISYDSDIDTAKNIMLEEALAHPLHVDNRTQLEKKANKPIVVVRVFNLGESSVDLRLWVWTRNQTNATILSCDLKESIKKRFDKENVEIPYPHRTLIQKK